MPLKKPRSALIVHTDPATYVGAIQALGWTPVPCPVLRIAYRNDLPPPADMAIVTSIHALQAAKAAGLPVAVVGEHTADRARDMGLHLLAPAAERIADLGRYRGDWEGRSIVHLCGRDVSPETPETLQLLGAFAHVVYDADAVESLAEEAKGAIAEGNVGAVLCFSARSVHVFTDLAKRATNSAIWPHVTGIAFSDPVAVAMQALPLGAVKVAAAPRRNSMLEILGHEQFSQF